MTSFYAIDFGNFKTIVACHDTRTKKNTAVEIPGLTELYQYGEPRFPIIHTAIEYDLPDKFSIAFDACTIQNLLLIKSQALKSNVQYNSSFEIKSGDHVHYRQAAADFLRKVVLSLRQTYKLSPSETVGLAVSPELANIFKGLELEGVQLVVEQAAAVLATLGTLPETGIYIVVDFGAHAARLSVVQFKKFTGFDDESYCKLISIQSLCEPDSDHEIGGYRITEWLFQYFKQQSEFSQIGDEHWPYICKLKERLSFSKESSVKTEKKQTKATFDFRITHSEFEKILKERGLYASFDSAIKKAFQEMAANGFDEPARTIKGVIVVGGAALIPAFRRHLASVFGDRKVHLLNAVDGIASGAAQLLALGTAKQADILRKSRTGTESERIRTIQSSDEIVVPVPRPPQHHTSPNPELVPTPPPVNETTTGETTPPIAPPLTPPEIPDGDKKVEGLKSLNNAMTVLLVTAFALVAFEVYFKFYHMPELIRAENAAITKRNAEVQKLNAKIRAHKQDEQKSEKQANAEQRRAAAEVLLIERRRQDYGTKREYLRELERWLRKHADSYDPQIIQLAQEKQRQINQLKSEGIHDP